MYLWGANSSGVAHGPVTVLVLVVTVVWVIVGPDDVNVVVG